MNTVELRIIESSIVLVVYILLRVITRSSINRTVKNNLLQKTRGKIIKKISHGVLLIVAFVAIISIWGVNRSELIVFMTSVLTVIGIALVAQWSLLSNISSGLIIFFNHSIRLDDTIVFMDKDYEIEGRISDIGLFFVKLKTKEGEEITLPNNLFIQKMIKKKTK